MEKRFHKLDLDRSGSISIGEFVSVPELKENPLVKRVVEIFDSDLDGEVDFKGNCLLYDYKFLVDYLHIAGLDAIFIQIYMDATLGVPVCQKNRKDPYLDVFLR